MSAAAAGGRENRDFRLPAVVFRRGRQTAALSAYTREIRRDPDDFRVGRSTGVRRDRSGYTIVGYWTLFLRWPLLALPIAPLQSWSERATKCAKIVHLSVVFCRTTVWVSESIRGPCAPSASLYYCRGRRARCAEIQNWGMDTHTHTQIEYTECFNINIKCSFQDDTRAACAYKINLISRRKVPSIRKDALTCTSFDYLLYTWGRRG